MTRILETGCDEQHTKAENLSMEALDEASIWPMDTEPFADSWPTIAVRITTKHAPNDFFQVGSIDVVSDRIKAVMESFAVEAEFLPIQVLYKKKAYSKKGYFFCHALREIDCFDRNRGKCTFHENPEFCDHIDEILNLAIDEDKAAGHHLFRLAKGAEYILCVSDQLAERILDAGCTGARFVAPEDWR